MGQIQEAMRAGARRILAAPRTDGVPELLTFTSMARAVACRDTHLAAALRLASATARHRLGVQGNDILLDHPTELSGHIRTAKANCFGEIKSSALLRKGQGLWRSPRGRCPARHLGVSSRGALI